MTLLSTRVRSWALFGGVALPLMVGMLTGGGKESTPDEAAFLYAVTVWRHGSVLYRDVFLGVTPLSVYVTGSLMACFGDEALVLRALIHACVAAAALLSARLVIRLGGSDSAAAATALATVTGMTIYCLSQPSAAYSPLAVVWLLGAWLVDAGGHGYYRAVLAGALAGLAFSTKQNIGLLVLLALGLRLALQAWRQTAPHVLWRVALQLAGFVAAIAVTLAPVWWSGGRADFLDLCFRHKTVYMAMAGTRYLSDVSLNPIVWAWNGRWSGLTRWTTLWLHLLPLTVAGLFALRYWQHGEARARTEGVLVFVAAAAASLYPRADSIHVLVVSPALLVGAAYLWDEARRHWPSVTRWCGMALVAVWANAAVYAHLVPVYKNATGQMVAADLPHFRGTRWPPNTLATLRQNASALRKTATEVGPPFLLMPSAAFFYLIAEVRSPTPYIYPLVTAFGTGGEDATVQRIQDGSLRAVCVGNLGPAKLAPQRLPNFVKSKMVPSEDLKFCRLYRLQAGPPGNR